MRRLASVLCTKTGGVWMGAAHSMESWHYGKNLWGREMEVRERAFSGALPQGYRFNLSWILMEILHAFKITSSSTDSFLKTLSTLSMRTLTWAWLLWVSVDVSHQHKEGSLKHKSCSCHAPWQGRALVWGRREGRLISEGLSFLIHIMRKNNPLFLRLLSRFF